MSEKKSDQSLSRQKGPKSAPGSSHPCFSPARKPLKQESFIANIEQCPPHLIDNEYIKGGYRLYFTNFKELVNSLFMWHNETINVWTHLLGALMVICLIFYTGLYIQSNRQRIITNLESFQAESKQFFEDYAEAFKNKSIQYMETFDQKLQEYKHQLGNVT